MVQTTKWSASVISDLRLNEQTMFWGTTDPTSGLPVNAWFFNTNEKKIKQNTGTEGSPTWTTRFDAVSSFSLTKGNILVSNGTTWIALGVGTNTDVITADSGEASGIKWSPPIGGWEEIGRTTLTVAADTISAASFAAKNYLMVMIYIENTVNTTTADLEFNNDASAIYKYRYSVSGGTEVTASTDTKIDRITNATGAAGKSLTIFWIANYTVTSKIGHYKTMSSSTDIRRLDGTFLYSTATRITRVDVDNTASGDFGIGSEIVVFGRD